MRNIHSTPFLRIVFPFIVGIIFFKLLPQLFTVAFVAVFLLAIFAVIGFQFLSVLQKIKLNWINGLAMNGLLIALGFLIYHFHFIEHQAGWYQKMATPTAKLRAKIISPIKITERTYKANVEITGVYEKNKFTKTHGEAILYFQQGDALPQLNINDEIVFVNKLNAIIPKGNPGEFNYAAFSQNRDVYDQAFLSKNEWQKVTSEPTYFQNPFPVLHEKIKEIISENIPHAESKGIALALITGYRNDIDKEIYNQYTKTGLVHLLAISGLHMGVFYYGTIWVLGFIPFFKKRKKSLIVLSLIIMWLFAMVTTFPPSVQRASVMFTFLGIGQLINRKIPSVNFLFASAFFLLLLQPHLLFEVGFQLSYTAVLGILLFFIPLRNGYFPKNKVSKFLWEIMCLSFSAQLLTFPIAIYYFHQFPLIFLLTNMVAIPLVTVIIYGEVFLIILSFIPGGSKFFGIIVDALIRFLNWFIDATSSISFVSITNIQISLLQCFLLLAIMLCMAAWFLAKQKLVAPLALILFLGFMFIAVFEKMQQLQQHKIMVYNSNTPYLEILSGSNFYTKDSSTEKDSENFVQYTVGPSHLYFGIKNSADENYTWQSNSHYDFIHAHGTSLLRVRKAYKLKSTKPIVIDYLIISDKWVKNIAELLTYITPRELIIDGNIPLWKIEDIKSQLREVNLPIHYISTNGAKIISL